MTKDVGKYFFKMGVEEQMMVRGWLGKNHARTEKQLKFIDIIANALSTISYEYAIATIEPSFDSNGEIDFCEGEPVAVGLSNIQWEKAAAKYAPEYKSDLATQEELLLWYAYRIAKGYWSLEYICDEPTWIYGNDLDFASPSADKEIGGFKDGVGNTHKIVKSDSGYVICGENYEQQDPIYAAAIATVNNDSTLRVPDMYGSGVFVLKKNI